METLQENEKPLTFLAAQVFNNAIIYPSFVVDKNLDLVTVLVGDPYEEDSKLKQKATLDGYRTVFVFTEDYDRINHEKRYIFIDALTARKYDKDAWREEFEKIWSKKSEEEDIIKFEKVGKE